MGCGSCTKEGLPKGCRNNGSCGVDGCEKLTVFDWLSDMELPSGQKKFDWMEVRFKNGRKHFYKNTGGLNLHIGDVVTVEGSPGYDVGAVSLNGELVKLQMKKKGFSTKDPETKKILRVASQRDIDTWKKAQARENDTMIKTRQIAKDLKLEMKISDVEYQGDNGKATFFYTADDRVDFRELIKVLASEFRIRVEMRQIGTRQEAGRVGGIGSCGRELCCSTWLTDFRSVNTSAARYQQLALNPQKLAGQCGKLKCCLNYELDQYVEAIKDFPPNDTILKTKKGEATIQKIDIFKRKIWFSYRDSGMDWVPLDVEKVKELMAKNKGGELPEALEDFNLVVDNKPEYSNVVGEESLSRFDHKNRKKKKRRKNQNKPNKKRGPKN